jgi:hypothetical protein
MFVVAYLFLNLIVISVHADIIYFKDGMKTICQDKAWEENGQIKCDYAGWVLTYSKEDVQRIVKTNPKKKPATPNKKPPRDPIINKDIHPNKPKFPQKDGITFYNPRRPYKYWTGKNSRHKTYKEAIQTLAQKYGRSPEWIQAHMGDSNDLYQIHRSLTNPHLNPEDKNARKPVANSPGIAFYNPRRTYPYWTSKTSKHKSYSGAIKTLAEEYNKSPQWIRNHMGNSNDLNKIRENLNTAK